MDIDLVDLLVHTDAEGRHLQSPEEARFASATKWLDEDQGVAIDREVHALNHGRAVAIHRQRAGQRLWRRNAMPCGSVFCHTESVSGEAGQVTSTVVKVSSTLIDLHMHSTSSDGKLSPTALVQLAADRGLDLIALTDHDTLRGIDEAQAAGRDVGVVVRPGIELSGHYPDGQCHLLAWLPDPVPTAFFAWTHVKERDREARAREMVERLQGLGLDLTWDDVRAAAEFNIGRPHVADALVTTGAATSRKDAFEHWIGVDCPGYVPSGKTEPAEIIERVVEAGGVISLAHPYSLNLGHAALDAYVQGLADVGLSAIEAHRPDQNPATQAAYHALAERHGLLVSTGSDFHDLEREEQRLRPLGGSGSPGISADDREALLSRLPGARDALAG